MALLLQDLYECGYLEKPDPNLFVIKTQNVADYIFAQSEKENWDSADFPSVAPPFPSMWFEWRTPPFSNSGGKIMTMPVQPREGVHILSIDTQDEPQRIRFISRCVAMVLGGEFKPGGWEEKFGRTPECRWICVAIPYSEYNKRVIAVGLGAYGVREDGTFQRYSDAAQYAIVTRLPVHQYGSPDGHEVGTRINVGLFVPFLATSYMHCKNVKVEKSEPTPQALARRRLKDGKPPILRHHTIKIDAMGRKTSFPAAEAGAGGEKSLHICRGHFKKFGEKYGNRGLFGKYDGMFWWPMHARGNSERGVVTSDYDIKGA